MFEWMGEAACKGRPELFYPETTGDAATAKAICGTCPVTRECLALAMKNMNEYEVGRYGIWGSTSVEDRRRLRSRRSAVAA